MIMERDMERIKGGEACVIEVSVVKKCGRKEIEVKYVCHAMHLHEEEKR